MTHHEDISARIRLRAVEDSDLELFFKHQQDPTANQMAAFTVPDPNDREVFEERWTRFRSDPSIIPRTILFNGQVVGTVMKFEMFGDAEVTYWIDKTYWGKGIATAALRLFLVEVAGTRPIFARAAKDNTASIRVLQKCGFVLIGEDKGYANARGKEIDEVRLRLD
jgi:RimJ/RimL family protein N-acetyltransferase